jgi:hypothetical protein
MPGVPNPLYTEFPRHNFFESKMLVNAYNYYTTQRVTCQYVHEWRGTTPPGQGTDRVLYDLFFAPAAVLSVLKVFFDTLRYSTDSA